MNLMHCSRCFEAFIISATMDDAEIRRFEEWADRHGPTCTNAPLRPITSTDLYVFWATDKATAN